MGFLKVLRLRHLAILWWSQVLSAIGDRFYLIAVTLTMIQTDLPADQVGKVYSLRTMLESLGLSLGLLLAVPLFAYLSIPLVIALCALVMIAIGLAGLVRFGFSEPGISAAQFEHNNILVEHRGCKFVVL